MATTGKGPRSAGSVQLRRCGDLRSVERRGAVQSVLPDCNDLSAAVYPGASEICDGLDNDCDGIVDSPSLPNSPDQLDVVGAVIQWNSDPGTMTYDVVMGDLYRLQLNGGDFSVAKAQCIAADYSGSALNYGVSPGPGEGFFFLVRGTNCQGNGTYDTIAASQAVSRDAGIAASGRDCP